MFHLFLFAFLIPSFVYAEVGSEKDTTDSLFITVCSTGKVEAGCDFKTLEEALTYIESVQLNLVDESAELFPKYKIIVMDSFNQTIGSHNLNLPINVSFGLYSSNTGYIVGENNAIITTNYPIKILGNQISIDSLTIVSNNKITDVEALTLQADNSIVTNFHLTSERELACGNGYVGLKVSGNLLLKDSTIDGFDLAVLSNSIPIDNDLPDVPVNVFSDLNSDSSPLSSLGPAHKEINTININSCDLSGNSFSFSGSSIYTVSGSKLTSIFASGIGFLNLKSDNHFGNLKVKAIPEDETGTFDYCTNKGIFYVGEIPSIEMAKDLFVDINKTKKIQNMIEYFREDAANAIDFDYEVIYGEDSDVTKEYVKVTDGTVSILQPGMVTIKATRGDGVNEPVETYYLNLTIEKAIINPGTGTVLLIGFVILLVVSLVVITILTKRKKK